MGVSLFGDVAGSFACALLLASHLGPDGARADYVAQDDADEQHAWDEDEVFGGHADKVARRSCR